MSIMGASLIGLGGQAGRRFFNNTGDGKTSDCLVGLGVAMAALFFVFGSGMFRFRLCSGIVGVMGTWFVIVGQAPSLDGGAKRRELESCCWLTEAGVVQLGQTSGGLWVG
jgi:hypothetical protein